MEIGYPEKHATFLLGRDLKLPKLEVVAMKTTQTQFLRAGADLKDVQGHGHSH